jgi:hypothetical protein
MRPTQNINKGKIQKIIQSILSEEKTKLKKEMNEYLHQVQFSYLRNLEQTFLQEVGLRGSGFASESYAPYSKNLSQRQVISDLFSTVFKKFI